MSLTHIVGELVLGVGVSNQVVDFNVGERMLSVLTVEDNIIVGFNSINLGDQILKAKHCIWIVGSLSQST